MRPEGRHPLFSPRNLASFHLRLCGRGCTARPQASSMDTALHGVSAGARRRPRSLSRKGGIMSVEFFVRLIGMVVMAVGGIYLGVYLSRLADSSSEVWASVFAMVGALMGLVVTPFLTTRPIRALRGLARQISVQTIL